MASAVGGKAEAILPTDAFKADILNVRGNIERTYSAGDHRCKLGHMDASVHTRHSGSALCSYGPWRCDLVTGI